VNTYGYPYPNIEVTRRASPDTAMLTADEWMEVVDVLPISDSTLGAREARRKIAPLLSWAKRNPALARKSPAPWVIRMARYQLEESRVNAIRSPLAGTYRFVIALPTGDSLAFFARTEQRAHSSMQTLMAHEEVALGPDSIPHSVGYEISAQLASIVAELDTMNRRSERAMVTEGGFSIVEQPLSSTSGTTVWQGSANLISAGALLTRDPRMTAELRKVDDVMMEMHNKRELSYAPGRFIRDATGAVRYEMSITRNGTPIVSILGQRISRKHFADWR
jgi:hypothetical protein